MRSVLGATLFLSAKLRTACIAGQLLREEFFSYAVFYTADGLHLSTACAVIFLFQMLCPTIAFSPDEGNTKNCTMQKKTVQPDNWALQQDGQESRYLANRIF
ncbi:hypothetical protein [Candidatus Electronema sp. JM]|uniref:hypothetical protein n=1 Tax=Candidatus Electronema sp. JM TaxID=3401571 RepID=UPI003AA7E63B